MMNMKATDDAVRRFPCYLCSDSGRVLYTGGRTAKQLQAAVKARGKASWAEAQYGNAGHSALFAKLQFEG